MNSGRVYHILITGVGSIIGYGIIESLRIAGIPCLITGADIFGENYGRYICDHFEVAPYTSSPGYYSWLAGVCEKYSIDLIFPGIEQDVHSYNENRNLLPAPAVLNNEYILNLSKDKYETFLFLKSIESLPVIPTLTGLNYPSASASLGLPFIIKPRKSSASKGYYIIRNEVDFNERSREINADTLFQAYIGSLDEEYTYSVFGCGDGTVVDGMIMRRYLSKDGSTRLAYVIEQDDELQSFVSTLVKELKPLGPTNFQFRKQSGKAYLLEINPRISSACSLRSKFGYNEPKYCIEHYLEKGVYRHQSKKTGKAVRYISDKIIYE